MQPTIIRRSQGPLPLFVGALFAVLAALGTLGCAAPRESASEAKPTQQPPDSTRPTGSGQGNGGTPGSIGGPATDGPDPGSALVPDDAGKCPDGYHACDGKCASNTSPLTCGRACEACPGITGGTATCDGTRCGISCPSGQKPCVDKCIAMEAACEGGCPEGKNNCDGICVDAKSLTKCGKACAVCPTSSHGATSCDGEACALKCEVGYWNCEDQCIAETAACKEMCPPDRRLCNGMCVPGGPGSCCTETECGACKTCTANKCQNASNGQPGPMCMGTTCNAETLTRKQCQEGACVDSTSSCNNYGCEASDRCRTSCRSGTVRQGNTCVACGGNGQPCCNNSGCDSGSCRNGRCCSGDFVGNGSGCGCPDGQKSCGGTTCKPRDQCCNSCSGCQRCMDGECRDDDARCSDVVTVCRNGQCRTCGGDNQPCCNKDRNEQCFNVYRCHDGRNCSCKPRTSCRSNECGDVDNGCNGTLKCKKATCRCMNGNLVNLCTMGVTGCPDSATCPDGASRCAPSANYPNGYSECD